MSARSGSRYVLDAWARRFDGGTVLLGGSPLTLFRLSPPGRAVLDDLLEGRPPPAGAGPQRLIDRLLDAGVVHPVPGPAPFVPRDVTVVVPVLGTDPGPAVRALGGELPVIVVDDASRPAVPAPSGPAVTVVRRARTGGPAAARNTGLSCVDTPLVAFVDADVEVRPDWLEPLLGQFSDAAVALVAPRVACRPTAGCLGRYEAHRSPLDLGATPGRVAPGTRIAYVPGAAVVARTDAVRAVGGFDTELRFGEDVDLVWRLIEAGHRVRYEPAAVVEHRPRATVGGWLAQRAGYGRSAAPLARRHPGALAPLAITPWSAATWALVAAGDLVTAVAVAAGSTVALARRLGVGEHPVLTATRLAGRGHLVAGRALAAALTRAWWPLTLAAALTSRRARRVATVAALAPAVADWWREAAGRDPLVGPIAYVVLRVADDAAYGAGLWWGAIADRTLAPLRPALAPRPRSGAAARAHP